MEIANWVLGTVTTTVALGGGLGLLKLAIDAALKRSAAKSVEAVKADLATELSSHRQALSRELEGVRHQFTKDVVRLQRDLELDDRRIEAFAKLAALAYGFNSGVGRLMRDITSQEVPAVGRLDGLGTRVDEFRVAVATARLLMPELRREISAVFDAAFDPNNLEQFRKLSKELGDEATADEKSPVIAAIDELEPKVLALLSTRSRSGRGE